MQVIIKRGVVRGIKTITSDKGSFQIVSIMDGAGDLEMSIDADVDMSKVPMNEFVNIDATVAPYKAGYRQGLRLTGLQITKIPQ